MLKVSTFSKNGTPESIPSPNAERNNLVAEFKDGIAGTYETVTKMIDFLHKTGRHDIADALNIEMHRRTEDALATLAADVCNGELTVRF
jgi:hypothetical protein